MDSKEMIEKVAPVDAQAARLLDPSFLRLGTHDATTADLPREWADSPAGSCVSPDEHPRRQSNCLYVRVLRDSDAILEQDRKVPEYCWNAGISKDICEARTGVAPGTFSVDLLSNTEFLVYCVPKTTRGMSDREARCYADLIMGSYLWAGSPTTVFVTKRTTQEARRDKAKTREYRRRITVQRLATTQARLRDLDVVAQKCKERALDLVGRGRGMTRRADKYLFMKDGGLQFHRLNSRTKKDSYPRFFFTMDLKSGFWQVKMAKDSQQYTAFTVGSMEVYEFLRMPYGLCNAPVMFQRLMQNCLRELNLTYALIYLDDVIVFSHTEEEHLHCLRVVFGRFLEHGLKLKPSKCHFLQDQITFLGHEISADGMKPSTANLKAIVEMAPPKTYTEI